MGFKEWILPQDRVFFDWLEEALKNADASAAQVGELFHNYGELAERRKTIKDLEHKGDQISHNIHDALTRSFMVPIDREDLLAFTRNVDDVSDAVYAAVNRLYLYEITKHTPAMSRFAEILRQQTQALLAGLAAVRNPKTRTQALGHAIEVHRLENEADRLLNETVAALFRGSDAVEILKYKEIYEILEGATDRCEDVADVIADIVRKHR